MIIIGGGAGLRLVGEKKISEATELLALSHPELIVERFYNGVYK
jgi:hypothetical protein